MNKAICDMTKSELASEYLYCLHACNDEALEPVERSHYRRLVNAIYEYVLDSKIFTQEDLDNVRLIVESQNE